jgi:hypothetical protein
MENPDDWKGGLLLNGDRLEKYSVRVSIQAAGEHLLRARCIIKDLESSESLRNELNDALADELCEAMSRYCRTPAARFFNSFLIMKGPFSRRQNAEDPKSLRIFLGRMHSIMPSSRIVPWLKSCM